MTLGSNHLQRIPRQMRRVHPSIGLPLAVDEEDVALLLRDGAVLGAPGHDEEVAGIEHGGGRIAKLDGEAAVEDEEQLVGVGMRVPGEGAEQLGHPDLVAVVAGNDARVVNVAEACELVGEGDYHECFSLLRVDHIKVLSRRN